MDFINTFLEVYTYHRNEINLRILRPIIVISEREVLTTLSAGSLAALSGGAGCCDAEKSYGEGARELPPGGRPEQEGGAAASVGRWGSEWPS